MSVLKININFFLFKMFFKELSKLFSFNSFLTINLRDHIMITNEIIDKKKRSFDINILLLLYSHRLKTNNILFLNILKTTLCLFIYNFLKIKSYYFN